ncbi:MAG: 2Fe-2S iron-sulfur cluster-binding protein [Candidatus Micrarchaeia archaeon]
MAKITFVNDNKTVDVPAGTHLRKVIEDNGIGVYFPCGVGRCGSCVVKIVKGMEFLNQKTEVEKKTLEISGASEDKRLACVVVIEKDGEIVIETENVF